ncbi:hypothetical protein Scep_027979 [Stephania cephalantha]|uniref:Uncharacterized protein n=1 Tax=Stephania cephalantha TaxID=152367 RepID=A0AAP0EC97_9MAGN
MFNNISISCTETSRRPSSRSCRATSPFYASPTFGLQMEGKLKNCAYPYA